MFIIIRKPEIATVFLKNSRFVHQKVHFAQTDFKKVSAFRHQFTKMYKNIAFFTKLW